jgi:hypothetical protein
MLLQALNSSADSANTVNISDSNSNGDVVYELAVQLSQTTAEGDRVLEEMLHIGDQLAQIEKMVNLHWTSALAVALRKVCIISIMLHHPNIVLLVEQKLRTADVRSDGSSRADRAARSGARRRLERSGTHSERNGLFHHDRVRCRRSRHRDGRKGIRTELTLPFAC